MRFPLAIVILLNAATVCRAQDNWIEVFRSNAEISKPDEIDEYNFSFNTPVTVEISMDAGERTLNPYLEMMTDEGELVAADDNSGGRSAASTAVPVASHTRSWNCHSLVQSSCCSFWQSLMSSVLRPLARLIFSLY